MREVICEDPLQKIWRTLIRFTYVDVINHWWLRREETNDAELAFFIASSFQQAKSYFDSASNAHSNILPLLLYYGCVNLLVGTLTLTKHKKFEINNHGMVLDKTSIDPSDIFSIKLIPKYKTGALNVIISEMESITDILSRGAWSLDDVLSTIPDLAEEYQFVFPEREICVIKVEEVKQDDRLLDRIPIESLIEGESLAKRIKSNSNYSLTYLEPIISLQNEYLILNRKPGGEPYGLFSISGEKFLPIPIKSKGDIYLPQYLTMTMGLFILATLSKYHPEVWDTFLRYDCTGSKNLINEFLLKVERYFPNLILNIIEGERIFYKK